MLKAYIVNDKNKTLFTVPDGYEVLSNNYTNKYVIVTKKSTGRCELFDYNGNQLNIGSGLSDQQRVEWFKNENLIIGKQILVKYKELTKNQQGTVSLSFATLAAVLDQRRDF